MNTDPMAGINPRRITGFYDRGYVREFRQNKNTQAYKTSLTYLRLLLVDLEEAQMLHRRNFGPDRRSMLNRVARQIRALKLAIRMMEE